MLLKYLMFIYLTTFLVFSSGVKGNNRKPKFLTFETIDGEVSVGLEFSVPFLTISTKKVIDSAVGVFSNTFPTVNINPGALALGSAVLLGTTIIIPLLLKKHGLGHPHNRISRLLEDAEFSSTPVLDAVGEIFLDSKTVRGCILKISCYAAQQSTTDFDPLMAWNSVVSNTIISSFFNSSVVEDAMLSGKNGRDCKTYTPCPVTEDYFPVLVGKFANLANSVG